jgi:hypothetical protein
MLKAPLTLDVHTLSPKVKNLAIFPPATCLFEGYIAELGHPLEEVTPLVLGESHTSQTDDEDYREDWVTGDNSFMSRTKTSQRKTLLNFLNN